MHQQQSRVTGGVDTHAEIHVAAVIDSTGRPLATASFPASQAGYRQMWKWFTAHGQVERVGIEGTGSYGVGLARHLTDQGVVVLEVNRPNRQARRRHGKNDTVDAIAAARSALNGDATGTPKSADGPVESIRALRVTRRSAIKARTQATNQITSLLVNAPSGLRDRLSALSVGDRIDTCARFRPGALTDPAEATKAALRSLARRHLELSAEIVALDQALLGLCAQTNPALLGARGVGPEVAATLLVTAGDNPHRLRSEAAFAALCGVSPIEASSGKIVRHRLNRGGDRAANNALWRIVMVRLTNCDRTRAYVARRRAEGRTTAEILRCLKRHVAREIYRLLTNPPTVPRGPELRQARTHAGISLRAAATELATSPMTISRLERELGHDTELATRYHHWLTQTTAA